ncbi:retropepsin-like aspartic protease family protein [Sphingomonas cavernae]|uniref:retropepsin-like aspartic protease family protein n=1 Tax=Sphingomonas cavernae TaxID=2320861 RepID=UPI0016035E0C|nr:TIGR02281 family clan AA aspartic protease [Sphingomonas cavernae]
MNGKHLIGTGIGLGFAAIAVVLGINHFANAEGGAKPAAAPVDERVAAVRVNLADDQTYYLTAKVNGVPIRFLVDTGATITVLRLVDAQKAGIALRASDFTGDVEGIDGHAAVAEIVINRLEAGEILVSNIEADVDQGALDVSLLGQNFLSRLERIVIEDGVMTLQGKPAM